MKELNSAIQKIEEIYVGDFDLDDNEKSIYNSKLKRHKSPKIVKSGEYEIKIAKYNTETIVGIPDIGFIVINNDADLKYLQWTRSYVKPDYRGKGILELLVQTALSNNIRPLILDYTLSIAAAKHFEKILKNPKFSVKIYDVDDDIILPYKPDAKIYHSPEGEFSSSHTGAEYKDAEKYVWLIEHKSEIDVFTEDLEYMVKKLKTHIPAGVENITFDYHDNSDENIKEGIVVQQNNKVKIIVEDLVPFYDKDNVIHRFTYSTDEELSKQIMNIFNSDISKKYKIFFENFYHIAKKNSIQKSDLMEAQNNFEKLKNKVFLNPNIFEDYKITQIDDYISIYEAINAEISKIIINHFDKSPKNYFFFINYRYDENGKVISIDIKENKNKKELPNFSMQHFSFNYQEEFKKFLFDIKIILGGEYSVELEGIPVEDLKSKPSDGIVVQENNKLKIVLEDLIPFYNDGNIIERFTYADDTTLFLKLNCIFDNNLNTKISIENIDHVIKRNLFEEVSYNNALLEINKLRNKKKFNMNVYEMFKIENRDEYNAILEVMNNEIYNIAKNHFDNSAKNYILFIKYDYDENGKILKLNIKENKNKKPLPSSIYHFSFNYQEEFKKFLFDIKIIFGGEYTIELEGIPAEELKSNNLNEQLIKAENNIKNFYNKKFKGKDAKRFTDVWGFDYNSAFAENANFELEEDLGTISETFLKELDNLIKNNIIDIGINYILKILLTFDDEGKAIIIEIIKNEKKEQIPFKTVGLTSKISFNYQEDIKNLLTLIILSFSNNYKIYLEGIPVEELKRNIKEGGGAFKHPEFTGKIRRIKREEIDKTLKYIAANITNHTNMDYEYLKNHIMGSTGKQADSGDIDIAVDEEHSSRETLVSISKKVRELFTQNYSKTEGLNAGQLNTLIPIKGDKEKGLVQVDFIIGNPEWLKFTHHSPGADVSPYKGVFISQALGVIAKMKKIWDYSDDAGERVGRIGWAYDLEKGLYIRTQIRKRKGQGLSKVSPDEFESFPWHEYGVNPPRVPRVGYINNPEEVVKILLGKSVKPSDINTFEKLLAISKTVMGNKYSVFLERLKASLKRSSAQAGMPKIAIDDLDIFKEDQNNFETLDKIFGEELAQEIAEHYKHSSFGIKKCINEIGNFLGNSLSENEIKKIIKEVYTDKNLEEWLLAYAFPKLNENNNQFIEMQIRLHEMFNTISITTKMIDKTNTILKNTHLLGADQSVTNVSLHIFNNQKELNDFVIQLKLVFGNTYRISQQ